MSASASTSSSSGSAGPALGPSSRSANAGTATTSSTTRKHEQRRAPWPRASPCGRSGASRKPSKPPCSRSATNRRLMPSIAANSSVTHSTPAASSPSTVSRSSAKWKSTNAVTRTAPSPARSRACAARAAGPCAGARDDAPSPVQLPMRSASTLGRGARERRPPAAQPEHDVGLGQPAGRVVAGDHARAPRARPISGSTSSAAAGSRLRARLVEQQQLGVVQHRAAHGDALDHPARQRAHRLVGAPRQPDLRSSSSSTRASATPCRRAWKRRFSRAVRSR